MTISARKFAFVASVAMFSAGALAPLMGQPTRHQTAPEVQGFRTCAEMLRSDCNLVVMASAKDDDWTASGGALRGLNK